MVQSQIHPFPMAQPFPQCRHDPPLATSKRCISVANLAKLLELDNEVDVAFSGFRLHEFMGTGRTIL